MNKTKIKEDILLVLITLIGLFLFLAIYLTFSTSIYKYSFKKICRTYLTQTTQLVDINKYLDYK